MIISVKKRIKKARRDTWSQFSGKGTRPQRRRDWKKKIKPMGLI